MWIVIVLAFLFLPAPVQAIPTRQVAGVEMPDFDRLSFALLPALAFAGRIDLHDPTVVPPGQLASLIARLGYDPSRVWSAGARPEAVLMLGDLAEAFGLEQLNLSQIASYSGKIALGQLRLADLKLLAGNTVADVVDALGYRYLPVEAVPLLADLARGYFGGYPPQTLLGELIQQVPAFAALPLGTANLAAYALGGLPGIEKVALGRLAGWAEQFIRDVPGLSAVPFARFVRFPTQFPGVAGLVDIPLAKIEQRRVQTITGSDVEGFAVPCLRDCLHVELGDPLRGLQWIGRTQLVRGGRGLLGAVNGGREPTGRLPFGPWGKIVLTEVDEQAGSADFGLYFRVCIRTLWVDLGCTPYFIGPIPWIPVQEKVLTFVGP